MVENNQDTTRTIKRKMPRDSWANLLLPSALILGLVLLLSLDVEQTTPESASGEFLESWVNWLLSGLAAGTEIAAALVIGSAVVRSVISYLSNVFAHPRHQFNSSESIRLQLGRGLVLGLEFTVASDILRTAVAPTRQDILNLGAIVLLRTLLNHFLEQEINQAEQSSSFDQEK